MAHVRTADQRGKPIDEEPFDWDAGAGNFGLDRTNIPSQGSMGSTQVSVGATSGTSGSISVGGIPSVQTNNGSINPGIGNVDIQQSGTGAPVTESTAVVDNTTGNKNTQEGQNTQVVQNANNNQNQEPQTLTGAIVQGLITGISITSAQLVAQLLNRAIFGTPGEQALAFMDAAFPGTNAWERLGGSNAAGQVANMNQNERMQIRELDTRVKIAQIGISPAMAKVPSEVRRTEAQADMAEIDAQFQPQLLAAGLTQKETASVLTWAENIRKGKVSMPAGPMWEWIGKQLGGAAHETAKPIILNLIQAVTGVTGDIGAGLEMLSDERLLYGAMDVFNYKGLEPRGREIRGVNTDK